MAKIIKLNSKEEQEKYEVECSICRGNFDVEGEGGLVGSLGILPVQFCPTCLSGIFNMVDYLRGKDEEVFDKNVSRLEGIHRCNLSKHYGDWRISKEESFLELTVIEHLLLPDKLQEVSFDDIRWKGKDLSIDKRGMSCVCCDGRKYKICDARYPGILVTGIPNSTNSKYRMIDGKHRIEKLISRGDNKGFFYVLEFSEVKEYFMSSKDGGDIR